MDPSINRGPYSAEEDKTILDLQAKMGNKWSEIARMMPGRTENAVKVIHEPIAVLHALNSFTRPWACTSALG